MTSSEKQTFDIRIHPLIILSIGDQYTRTAFQYNTRPVVGALMGIQKGQEVSVFDILEINATVDVDSKTSSIKYDSKQFKKEIDLFKKAFPNYDFLGWYSTGTEVIRDVHLPFHQLMKEYHETPVFLLLNPNCSDDSKELPLNVFEEEVRVVDEKTVAELVPRPYTIQSTESERITASHCSQITDTDNSGSVISPHIKDLSKSITALRDRVALLSKFLRDVENKTVKADLSTLRAIKGVCNRLPVMDSSQFHHDFQSEHADTLLVSMLASVTKGNDVAASTITKFNQTFNGAIPRHGMRGGTKSRGMGVFFQE